MGGGDLNSKKSWHPNTMKNQERVWKAEQAAAEEVKRMSQLKRERAEERDRCELNNIMNKNNTASDNDLRLSWMYDKPDKNVIQEEYLLGKALNKYSDQSQNVVQDSIPAVSRRVVGSSMLTAAGDTQVDMARKLREDPLLLIKERERAARAALLNNPLQRRKLTELLRKEQVERSKGKVKKTSNKKHKDLDVLLTAKLNALGGQKEINLATLLDSDDSSSESEEKFKTNKRKREQRVVKKKRRHSSDEETDNSFESKSADEGKSITKRYKSPEPERSKYSNKDSRYQHSTESSVHSQDCRKTIADSRHNDYKLSCRNVSNTSKHDPNDMSDKRKTNHNSDHKFKEARGSYYKSDTKRYGHLREAERNARLAEMAAAGADREVQRGKRVAEQRAADESVVARPHVGSFRHEAQTLPQSLESRIHSNRHYIQRDKRHMNEHFARRR